MKIRIEINYVSDEYEIVDEYTDQGEGYYGRQLAKEDLNYDAILDLHWESIMDAEQCSIRVWAGDKELHA